MSRLMHRAGVSVRSRANSPDFGVTPSAEIVGKAAIVLAF